MITLVTGGARSGKSKFAESLYEHKKDVVYIATAKVTDDEMRERIRHHQSSRPKCWRTYEANYHFNDGIGKEKNYLLDCMTILTSNIMFDISKDSEMIDCNLQKEVEDRVILEVSQFIEEIRRNALNLVIVTNEVGDSIVPEHHISRVFRDIQGRVNQRVAALSDQVYLVCCGIPWKIK